MLSSITSLRGENKKCVINEKLRAEQHFLDLRLGKDQQMVCSLEGFVTSDKDNGLLSPSGFLPEENKCNKGLSPAHSLTYLICFASLFALRYQLWSLYSSKTLNMLSMQHPG